MEFTLTTEQENRVLEIYSSYLNIQESINETTSKLEQLAVVQKQLKSKLEQIRNSETYWVAELAKEHGIQEGEVTKAVGNFIMAFMENNKKA